MAELGITWDDARHPIRNAKQAVRDEARAAVMPWVLLSIGLALLALHRSGRRR